MTNRTCHDTTYKVTRVGGVPTLLQRDGRGWREVGRYSNLAEAKKAMKRNEHFDKRRAEGA
jgi:hypothetical protein